MKYSLYTELTNKDVSYNFAIILSNLLDGSIGPGCIELKYIDDTGNNMVVYFNNKRGFEGEAHFSEESGIIDVTIIDTNNRMVANFRNFNGYEFKVNYFLRKIVELDGDIAPGLYSLQNDGIKETTLNYYDEEAVDYLDSVYDFKNDISTLFDFKPAQYGIILDKEVIVSNESLNDRSAAKFLGNNIINLKETILEKMENNIIL